MEHHKRSWKSEERCLGCGGAMKAVRGCETSGIEEVRAMSGSIGWVQQQGVRSGRGRKRSMIGFEWNESVQTGAPIVRLRSWNKDNLWPYEFAKLQTIS
ncbi:unnamed protein product [Dovyalis caffra]|uniref:Uncharacterized protein n=1 Tax=Dovyalis caffra TaxID=77055 RepID=A0AAV1S871_9ROSI|nr:unnamed protein product [Dovyalis caffra]